MFIPTTDDDVPAIAALMNRAYRGGADNGGWTTEDAYLAGDRTTAGLLHAEIAAAPDAAMLVWPEPDGALSGCVRLEPVGDGVWYLGSLAVDPARQGAGLGRTVLSSAEAWVREQGGTRVRMTVVNVRETLIGWYERRGYRRTGKIIPFPYGDERLGTPLRDDLSFVVLEKSLP
ncbi:GNAT family N-acetyltransferase [Sphingomonas bacterium]|uniref:GNAT family N-acetyltransferase n=1 Tax=Sphingomonas bacterium TaxID=1895847 RepID=UPI0015763B78|nr:GNAT family N-acetyltransferase [Sphingomonas bacterium]